MTLVQIALTQADTHGHDQVTGDDISFTISMKANRSFMDDVHLVVTQRGSGNRAG